MFGRTEVRVVERWQHDSFDVFVFPAGTMKEGARAETIHRQIEPGVWKTEPIGDPLPFTGLPQPSFSVPRDVMEEMLRAAKKIVPSLDRDDAVSDARATRDRLLNLVEIQALDGIESPVAAIGALAALKQGKGFNT